MILTKDQEETIDALLPQVAFDGWTAASLRQALVSIGRDPADAPLLFPNGTAEMIEAWCSLADARMAAAAAAMDLTALRVPGRVRAIIALRLEQNRDAREAVRRALAWLSLPANARLSGRSLAATVDAIWHAAGDTAADFSWYTKRGTLAAVYGATLLYWLRDTSEDDAETLAFLDRRLGNVGQIGKLRRQADERLAAVQGMFGRFTRQRS
jgi:ubiquinone biosynthesis protein COQ9